MSENARDNGLCREHRGLRQMIKPSDLKVVNENEQYYLKAGEDLIRDADGNVIVSKTRALLERIVADFERQGNLLLIEDGIITGPRIMSASICP